MPIPQVKEKERSRTKSGRWRKKRSDVGKPRKTETQFARQVAEDERPFPIYEQCSGCAIVTWSWALNERGFCGGIVKEPNPKEDVLRFCFIDKDGATYLDHRVDEAFEIAALLAELGAHYIKKTRKKKNKR